MANLPIKYVKDKDGRFIPITSPKAVIDENGKNITEVFATLEDLESAGGIKKLSDTSIVLHTLDTGIYVLDNEATVSVYNGKNATAMGAGSIISTIRRRVDYDDGTYFYASAGEIIAQSANNRLESRYTFSDVQGSENQSRLGVELVYRTGALFINGVSLLNTIYPVGSLYLTINPDFSPSEQFGGSWTLVYSDCALWTTASATAGEVIPAGLPNITGSFGGNQDQGATGAFYKSKSGVKNSGMSAYACIVQLDASRSSSIYGASSTVQPPAYTVYAWRRVT